MHSLVVVLLLGVFDLGSCFVSTRLTRFSKSVTSADKLAACNHKLIILRSTPTDVEKENMIKSEQIRIAEELFAVESAKIQQLYAPLNIIVDDDSSEIEAGSSSDILIAKQLENDLEAAKKAAYDSAKTLAVEIVEAKMKKTPAAKPAAAAPAAKQPTMTNTSTISSTKPTAGKEEDKGPIKLSSGTGIVFDAGLIIAFPIILGTLFFFLFFPIIAPQIAPNLPPPMSY